MAFLFDYPGFSDPERGPGDGDVPFPRWKRRMAEAEALLAWGTADGHRTEPDRGREDAA